ncbi:MAG: hypothetical protein ABTQ34_07900 [Bdellovibrionales bacterium]
MYLLVFVTLVIGLIGIYGQILTAQTARIAAGQTGFAQTMQDWHVGAVSMAVSVLKGGYSPVATGCSLTDVTLPGSGGLCPNAAACGGGSGVVTNSAGTLGSVTTGGPTCELVHLPSNYKAQYFQFYSVLYMPATGGRYVLTWVPPPTTGPAPGYIVLPTKYQTSITMSDLAQQFRNVAKAAPYTHGTVKNGKISFGGIKDAATQTTFPIAYDVPSSYVKEGSIAIISSADGY